MMKIPTTHRDIREPRYRSVGNLHFGSYPPNRPSHLAQEYGLEDLLVADLPKSGNDSAIPATVLNGRLFTVTPTTKNLTFL